METRYFETLDIHASLLGFGAMRFPTTPEGKIDRKRSLAMMKEAYEAGVNYFDVAPSYGNAEDRLGPALPDLPVQ